MTLQQLLAMIFERGNAMQSFWGFYISVSLGMLAFFGSSPRSVRVATLLSLGFIAFAVVNASGMLNIAEQREALWKLLEGYQAASAAAGAPLSEALLAENLTQVARPPSAAGVRVFHIACDVAVVVAIWVLTLWRGNAAKAPG